MPRRSLYFRSDAKRRRWSSCRCSTAPTRRVLPPQREHRPAAGAGAGQQHADAGPIAHAGEEAQRVARRTSRPTKLSGSSSSAFVRILCRPPTDDEADDLPEFLAEQATQLADPKSLTAFAAGPAAIVAALDRSAAARAREPGPRAVQSQRLRDGSMNSRRVARHRKRHERHRHSSSATLHSRAIPPAFLADIGMGFTGLALGAMLARDGVVRGDRSRRCHSRSQRPRPRRSSGSSWSAA